MATQEELNKQQEGITNSEKLLDLASRLNDALVERRKLTGGINAEEQRYLAIAKKQQSISQEISANAEKYLSFQVKSKDISKQIKNSEENQRKYSFEFQKIREKLLVALKSSVNELRKTEQLLKAENNILTDNYIKLDSSKALLDELNKRKSRGVKVTQEELQNARESYKNALNDVKAQENIVKKLENQKTKYKGIVESTASTLRNGLKISKEQEKEVKLLEQNVKIRKRIENSVGAVGALSKLVATIPGIGKYLKADEAVTEMEKVAAELEQTGKSATSLAGKLKVAGTGIKTLLSGAADALTNPVVMMGFFVSRAFKANNEIISLYKNLGTSEEQAKRLRDNFSGYVSDSEDSFVNIERLVKAQISLNDQLGIAVRYTNQESEEFSRLTEIMGLGADEASRLLKLSAANGKEYAKNNTSILKGAFYAKQQNNINLSGKQILQEVSKLSSSILVKFRGNSEELGKAVVAAAKLGTNLETVDQIGKSLLDFESSIENELKAELLTGKQLNLERARAAALAGDQVTLAEELSKQVGTLADYEKMNVIAREALAQSFGLNSDQMSEMLMKQEAINKFGVDAQKLNKEELRDLEKSGLTLDQYLNKQKEARTNQEKFNDAVTKMQEMFGKLADGPVGNIVKFLIKGLDTITQMFGVFDRIGKKLESIFGPGIAGSIGQIASVAAVGSLVGLVGKTLISSFTKGTKANPMIVQMSGGGPGGGIEDGFGGGIGRITKAFKGGGGKGAMKAASKILKGTLKSNALTSLLFTGGEVLSDLSSGKGVGESLGRGLLTGGASLLGGALGSLVAPGLGTFAGGAIGGGLGDKLGDLLFGEQQPNQVTQDGIAPSNRGPFAIMDSYGATAITTKGDSLAVSPNIKTSSDSGMADVVNEIRKLNDNMRETQSTLKTLMSRPAVAVINGEDPFAKKLGSNSNLGTEQYRNSYSLA
jgi:hypothetical protein